MAIATPFYLLHPRIVARIARYNPALRWIVLLRDPAERALSHLHGAQARHRTLAAVVGAAAGTLAPARACGRLLAQLPLRRHGYRLRGDYARQSLYAQFPREQVLLLSSRELRDNPTGSVRKVCVSASNRLPGSVLAETVFTGDYPRPARNSLRMRLLRWLLRRRGLRDMRERYGVEFD